MNPSQSPTQQEYRAAFTKLLWASPIANAAGLLAGIQLIGTMGDPDYAFRSLRWSIGLMGLGCAMGLCSILVGQLSLLLRIHAEELQNLEVERFVDLQELAQAEGEKRLARSVRHENWAYGLSVFGVSLLFVAGCWAFVIASNGRLQPREPAVPVSVEIGSMIGALAAAAKAAEDPQPIVVQPPAEKSQ